MLHRLSIALIAGAAMLLAGCVNTSQIHAIGPDTFTVSSTSDGMRSASDARSSALEAANKHCAALGRKINVVNETSERTRMGIDPTYTGRNQ